MTDVAPRDEQLAKAMDALGNPVRVALLRELRSARPLGEIELRQNKDGRSSILSRQAVREHLDRLSDAGLVQALPPRRDARVGAEYILNHSALYALAEELRSTAALRPVEQPVLATSRGAPPSVSPLESGPRLVVVKGLEEGASFQLSPRSGHREWVIGRRRGLSISLDYDPYVSAENSRLIWDGARHLLADAGMSTNGTVVNFGLLAPGEQRALAHGDVIGVGRTLMVYWSR